MDRVGAKLLQNKGQQQTVYEFWTMKLGKVTSITVLKLEIMKVVE